MTNIETRYAQEDLRPAFHLQDVNGADFIHVKAQHSAGTAAFALKSVADFNTYLSRPIPDTHFENVQQKQL